MIWCYKKNKDNVKNYELLTLTWGIIAGQEKILLMKVRTHESYALRQDL
jgi:hypothetical protein